MKYTYFDPRGQKQSIDVDDDLCITLLEEDRKEANLERKERDHFAMSIEFDGAVVADYTYEPSRLYDQLEEEERMEAFLSTLTKKQEIRARLAAAGYSYRDIARLERVDISTITESFKSIRKKAIKFYGKHPLKQAS